MRRSFRYFATYPPGQAPQGCRVRAALAQADEQERYHRNSWPVSRRHRGTRFAGSGVLEQFMRLKQNLYCGRHVSRNVRLNHRKEPAFVLHPSGKAKVGTHPIVTAHTEIGQCATSGNESLTYFLVSEIELQSVARAKPEV